MMLGAFFFSSKGADCTILRNIDLVVQIPKWESQGIHSLILSLDQSSLGPSQVPSYVALGCMGWKWAHSGELNRGSALTESKDFPPCSTPLMGRRKFLLLYQGAMPGLPKLLYSQRGKR